MMKLATILSVCATVLMGVARAEDKKAMDVSASDSVLAESVLGDMLKKRRTDQPFTMAMGHDREGKAILLPAKMEKRLLALAGANREHYVMTENLSNMPWKLRKRGSPDALEVWSVDKIEWKENGKVAEVTSSRSSGPLSGGGSVCEWKQEDGHWTFVKILMTMDF